MAKDNKISEPSVNTEKLADKSNSNNKKTQKIAKAGVSNTNENKNNSSLAKTLVKTKQNIVKKDNHKLPPKELEIEDDEPEIVRGKKKYGNSSLSAVIKTTVYIVVVFVIAVFLAIFITLAGNEVFALRKPDDEYTIVLEDYPDISAIADALYEKNVIKFPGLLKTYAKLKHKDTVEYKAGTYTVSSSMSYDALLRVFGPSKPPREQISITIPEGYSVDEIIDLLVSKGIGTRDGFIDVINNGEFNYWFLNELECSENRIYRLEGYLYPDTYYFYTDSSERTAINKMLENFKIKVRKSWKKRCEEIGMTFDEVLILASMIQEEARLPEDFKYVSSVFHNRLKSSEFDGLLQSDATIQYYYRNVFGKIKYPLTEEHKTVQSFYNTYMYKGLPPGPLSTPTTDAINAAMYPEQTNYYYFVTDNDGACLFAKTYSEHLANILAVENGKLAADDLEDLD